MKVYNDNQLYEVASWRPTMKFWSPELIFGRIGDQEGAISDPVIIIIMTMMNIGEKR